ncbi:thiol reductant ABC exporter subunit CydD [Streptomyces sp. NPDC005438]|uniref:thiol reductant ABC exporter subunit CydD n=1 Tax=Streptomyces sp. NPDC005438 TaxID=3156880 RepID=UPI0033AE356B
MRPVDPRLLRHARATRGLLAALTALGLVGALLVVAQAGLLAELVVGAFQRGWSTEQLARPLALLALVSVGRAVVVQLTETTAQRAGARVKSQLRTALLEHAVALGPTWLRERRRGELTTLACQGVDALDDYFSRYLPQLGLAVLVPVAVLARIVTADWASAVVIVVTLPLIPLFMALIGWVTQAHMDRRWRSLSRLSGHFLDVVSGLETLKVFGRSRAQADSIRRITGEYRRATLRTLRVAFLSSLVLELLATVSVALVAVGVGLRLAHGQLDLYTGLLVLILAPEAYLPLRQVGARYHAAAEGLAAAERIFEVLQTPRPAHGGEPVEGVREALTVRGLTVRYPGRSAPGLPPTSLTLRAGETVALVGPSGCGKSTLLSCLLGFTRPDAGTVEVDGRPLDALDLARWHSAISWVPQHPTLFAGTVAENVTLARPGAGEAEVRRALERAGLGELDPGLVLGERGRGLSAGQHRRVALARAVLADRPLWLLDEPTASLDRATEDEVLDTLRALTADRTVLLVTHRAAPLALADRVHRLAGSRPGAVPLPEPSTPGPSTPGPAGTGPAGTPDAPEGNAPEPGPGRHPLRWVRETARPLRGRLLLSLALGTLALGSAVGLMATSGWLISRASQQPPVLTLMVAVTATRAFGLGRAVFRYAERLLSHDAVLRALAQLRVRVYQRLERLAPAGLGPHRRGDLLTRLVDDVDTLQDYFLRWLLPAGAALLVGVGSVALTGWLLPGAGLLLAGGLVLAGVAVPWLGVRLADRATRQRAPARGLLATRTLELLTGTAELTVAGALGGRLDRVRRADAALTRIAARDALAGALSGALSTLVTGLTVTAVAALGVAATSAGRLDGVLLAVVVLTALAAFEPVAELPTALLHRQRVRRGAARVLEVLDAPLPVTEPEVPQSAPADPHPLRLRRAGARYPGAPRPALSRVSLTLTPGRRIALVGPSGSGKTTTAQLLLRFLELESGEYTLAGRDAAALGGTAVRERVGLCGQDAHLFDSDLRENLRLARPSAQDAELYRALDRARLGDWVRSLPDGLDTLVGEEGTRLSGGQRQRLALARALLADHPVLVLDEPAEHLDEENAEALTTELLALAHDRTTVLITHRLAGLEEVDEVLVLDRGTVVQRGTPARLARVPGPFAEMAAKAGPATRRAARVETPVG